MLSAASGQWVDTTFRIPDTFGLPSGLPSLAYDPDRQVMYIAGDESDTILVVEERTCRPVEKFAVGSPVSALARPGDRSVLFCALGDSGQVIALDCETRRPVARYGVGNHPGALLYCDAESKLCVANWDDTSVSVVDLSADSVVATIRGVDLGGLFQGMCHVPGARRAFLASQGNSQVVAIDLASDTVIARIPVGESVSALVYHPANNRVYCACWWGALYSIDPATCSIVAVLPDSVRARSIACDSQRNRVHLAAGSALAVIDGSADTAVRRVTGRAGCPWVCLDSEHNKVFAAFGQSFGLDPCGVTVVDGESFTQGPLLHGPGRPCAIGQWGAGGRVFCAGSGRVYVYDGVRGRSVGVLASGFWAYGLYADSASGKLYCRSDDLVTVIAPGTSGVLASIPIAGFLGPVCFNTVDRKVYVGDGSDLASDILSVLDGIGDTLLKEIDVRGPPDCLAYNPDDNVVYVEGRGYYPIHIIDGKGDSVIGHIEAEDRPSALVYNAALKKLYSIAYHGVAVIDPRTNRQVTRMDIGTTLRYHVLNSSGSRLYGTSFYDDAVFVIDCVNDTFVREIPVPAGNPEALCYNPVDDRLYVNSHFFGDSAKLSVIDCARDTVVAVLPVDAEYMWHDSQTDVLYCLGRSGLAAVDGPTSTVLGVLATDFYPEGITSVPGWPYVYVAHNAPDDGAYVAVINKALGPSERVVQAVPETQVTVARGRLNWSGSLAVMYDRDGRRVADVHRGENDVSRLAPGVYFVREAQAQAPAVRKVVLTR